LFIAVIAELLYFDKGFFQLQPLSSLNINQNIATFMQKNLDGNRFLPLYPIWSAFQGIFPYNAPSYYRIQSVGGYLGLLLNDYYLFVDNGINKSSSSSFAAAPTELPLPNPYSPLIDFLSVKYILTEAPISTTLSDGRIKFKEAYSEFNFHIYENLGVNEKFQLVADVITYPSNIAIDKISGLLNSSDLSKTVFIEERKNTAQDFQLGCKDYTVIGTVHTVFYTPNKIRLTADSKCNSILSTSEVFYPGWKATVDGKETEVYKSNIAFRSIYVPQGQHTIEFYYQPTIYYIGGAVSLVSFFAFILVLRKYRQIITT
jgi:hypothetical protein